MSTLEERFYKIVEPPGNAPYHSEITDERYCASYSEGQSCCLEKKWVLSLIKSEIEQAKHEAREEMRKAINSIDVVFNIEMRPETKEFFEMAVEETKKAMLSHLQSPNDCMCKERWNPGVVHRKDAPCYWPESPKEIT